MVKEPSPEKKRSLNAAERNPSGRNNPKGAQGTISLDVLQGLLDTNNEACFVLKGIHHHIIYANATALHQYGFSAEEFMDKPFKALYQQHNHRKNSIKIESGNSTHYKKNGQPVNVNLRINQTTFGNTQLTLVTCSDLTNSIRDIDQLKDLKIKFENYFNLALVGMAIISPQMEWLDVNPKLCEILGYNKEELLKTTWKSLTPEPEAKEEQRRFFKAVKNPSYKTSHIEKRYCCKDGRIILAEVSTTCVRKDNGSIDYFLALIQDITDRKTSEKELIASREKYRMLVESQNDLVVKLDVEGRFLFVSPSYCNLFGKTEQDLLHKKFMPMVHRDDRSTSEQAMNNLLEPPYTCYLERRAKAKDGWRWLAWSHKAILDQNEKVISIIGIGRDITEQKDAENRLRISEERFRDMVELLPQTVFETDNNFKLTFANQYAYKEFKTHPRDLDKSIPLLNLISKRGQGDAKTIISQLTNGYGSGQSYVMKRNDGTTFPAIINAVPIRHNGMFAGLRGIVTNISEQKMADDALRQSETNYRTIFELASDSIIIHDYITGKILDANRNALESYGLKTLDELLSYTFWNDPPYSYREVMSWISKTKQYGTQVFEWSSQKADGTSFWEEVHLSVVGIMGTPRIISISHNIDERKKVQVALLEMNDELRLRNQEFSALNEKYAWQNEELIRAKEKAEESDRLKSAFLANMSHEIRTPMNAILGFSGLLTDPSLNTEKQIHYAAIIKQRSMDLLKIINDILDISKIEANQLTLLPSLGRVDQLLENLSDFYTSRQCVFEQNQVEIRYCNQQKIHNVEIRADFGRLKQVLVNLIDNAIKFTPKGYVEFGCQVVAERKLQFHVKDTGIGIPQAKHAIVFERFRQVNESQISITSGTGLGLSISRGIVDLMGGEIWLESTPEVGTTFYFTIPAIPNLKPEDQLGYKCKPEEIDLQKSKILIIEDDKYNAEFLGDLLTTKNALVTHAFTGREAKKTLSLSPSFDLILLDIKLQDISGFELIKHIKTRNPKTLIIAQTAYASDDYKEACREAGCDDYISKPIAAEILLEKICNHLRRRFGK